ncbi:MAG: hypothetical protein ACREVW_01105 [Burkholderiales bacterium]
MGNEMTQAARNAYIGGLASPYFVSSPLDMAHRVGLYLHRHGFPRPDVVSMSRGYKVRAKTGGIEVVLDFAKDSTAPVRVAF